MTLWQSRLGEPPSEALLGFTESLTFDRRLAPYDIAASKAHVRALARGALISGDECTDLLDALDSVAGEIDGGVFEFSPMDEDVHTAIERRVTEIAGEVGGKLHTGRSRNDQVVTALRMLVRFELVRTAQGLLALQETLADRAAHSGGVYLPGYTHLQRAQPVLLAHQYLAHGWALSRDLDRVLATIDRSDVSTLGAGALAGSSLPLDPDGVASELGFSARFENSMDAVSDRDFVAEALFDLALIGVHLSRLGEEIVLWTSDEFGYARLADAYSTGSSMLPQKKNADIAELARGKAGRLIGHLTSILVTLKGLPLSYNRDLQEDKEPLFDAFDQVRLALFAVTPMIATMTIEGDAMREAADSPFAAAVDLAEWLVVRGVPFRSAHGMIATLVKESSAQGVPLADLVAAHPRLGDEAARLLTPGVSVGRRETPGGTGPRAVAVQAQRFAARLESDRRRLVAVLAKIGDVGLGTPPGDGAPSAASLDGSDSKQV